MYFAYATEDFRIEPLIEPTVAPAHTPPWHKPPHASCTRTRIERLWLKPDSATRSGLVAHLVAQVLRDHLFISRLLQRAQQMRVSGSRV